MKILITGGLGFIGSHLVEALVELGASVRAFVFYNSWNSIGWLSDLSDTIKRKIEIVSGDIRDDYCVTAAVEDREIVFHLASLIAIPYSYKAPRAFVDTNITGTLNVLQACRNSNALIRLVHTFFYHITELIVKKLLQINYKFLFNITLLFFFISNVSFADVSKPNTNIKAMEVVKIAECKAAEGQAINIGSGQEWSIEATAKLLMQCCGYDVPIISDEKRIRPKKSEVTRLVADPTRLQTLTTWQPQTSFSDGLLKTIDWIRANPRYFDPTVYSL